MGVEGRHERGTEVVVYDADGAEVRRLTEGASVAPIELERGQRAAVVWEGTHELALMTSDARIDARDRDEQRRRHGFETPLELAILGDGDDPLAAASMSMRGPDDAPALVATLAAEAERQRVDGGPFSDTSVLRTELDVSKRRSEQEQDASLGSLRVPGAPGDPFERPTVRVPEGALREGAADELRRDGWTVHEGDPGDEHDHVDRQGSATERLHVETVKWVVIRDAEGAIVEVRSPNDDVTLSALAVGETVALEEWPVSALPAAAGPLPADTGRPVVYAAYGSLTDDALQKLEEFGIDVEEVRDPDEPENDVLDGPDVHTDDEWDDLMVRDTATDGTVRELRVLPGGGADLSQLLPRRKVQVWIDLRFQYESEHPYGADDTLEEGRLRRFGKLVEQFANLAIENGEAEGMAIPSIVAHVLDKPDDPTPA